jgi:hypothetical protein
MFTRQHLTRVVAAAVAATALAAPVAGARPIDRPTSAHTADRAPASTGDAPDRTVTPAADEGFDVSSAAVGAGAAAAALLLSALGASAISRRHGRITALR